MSLVARAVPVPASFGCDTIYVFDSVSAARLKAASYLAHPLTFLWRYGADVSSAERDAILGAGWILLLVEHVRRPHWQSGGAAGGTFAGLRDVFHARRLGYPAGAHLAIDLEGLGDAGVQVEEYVRARSAEIRRAGYLVALYEGFDDGLTQARREALHDAVDVWWSDYGPRAPTSAGFVCRQYAQTALAGIQVDPDQCFSADALGRPLVGMALVDVEASAEDTWPAEPVTVQERRGA